MNRSWHYLLRLAVFAVCLAIPLAAMSQTDGGWATVDTRVLLMLHPDMANFDYSNGRFSREKSLEKDINKVVAGLKKAREQAEKECEPLRARQKKLFQDRFLVVQQKTRALQILAPGDIERLEREKVQLQTAYRELERQRPNDSNAAKIVSARKVDIESKLAEITGHLTATDTAEQRQQKAAKFQEQIVVIDKNVADIALQISKIEDKAISAVYLTAEETDTRLKKIKDEITSLIKQAAKESKVAVVMDTSFAMRSAQRKERLKMIPAVEEAPDIVSAAMFHSFANLTIDPELQKNLTGPEGAPLPPEHLTVGRSLGMRSNLTQYLDFRNYMPEKVADFSHGRLFLSGGTDLTPWVARQLFDRYKVPEFVKNSFMQLIRNYLDIEKDPETREREY
ncbi:MAG: hypothetical protein CVV41_04730 [Candidatus Riflebacteria bacterium HGW-Riflebacteria-1]|jgi:hypothetical protein|nr:MAG: hypothetical protein CVV41_04730 [Candidatus Riflebacteria bacterium HGW-Riflebacteria-1]